MPQKHLPKHLVGWREWIALPDLGIDRIKAKFDTGARTSALDVHEYRICQENNQKLVEFMLNYGTRKNPKTKICRAKVADIRMVRNSSGHEQDRVVIVTRVKIGDHFEKIEMTLSRRSRMKIRILLGRSAMKNFLIDPTQSYLTGKNKPLAQD